MLGSNNDILFQNDMILQEFKPLLRTYMYNEHVYERSYLINAWTLCIDSSVCDIYVIQRNNTYEKVKMCYT